MSDWTWEPHPDDRLDRLPAQARQTWLLDHVENPDTEFDWDAQIVRIP